MNRLHLLIALSTVLSASCGYHVGGKADLIPKSIQTIAVPSFASYTTEYRLGDMLPASIAREFRERSRFRVVADRSAADAVLQGEITRMSTSPTVSDPNSGKATSIQTTVTMKVQLIERSTGRILFSRPAFNASTQYELATDPHQTFDESGPAIRRMSDRVAQDIVSAMLEAF